MMLTINNGNVAVPDDGVYSAQAKLLGRGSWSGVRPAAFIDSEGFNSAIHPEAVFGNRQIPYLKHPLFPSALSPLYRVAGFAGMMFFSVMGVWLASITAGLLTRRMDPRLGIGALLLTGLASPLVFDAFLISAHGMAAGLCGLVLLGVAQIIDDRRWQPLFYALPSTFLLVSLRTEGVIAMVATVGVVALMAVHPRDRPKIDTHAAVAGLAICAVTVASYVIDSVWSRSIKASTGTDMQPLIRRAAESRDPLNAAWVSIVRPWAGDGAAAQPAIVIAVAAILLGSLSLKIAPQRWLLPVSLAVLAAGSLLYQNVGDVILITGLIATMPILAGGIILLRRTDFSKPVIVRHLLVSAISIVSITLTTYSVGGASEWGGRFYHILLPLLVPAALIGLRYGYEVLPHRPARVALASVVVASLSMSGLAIQHQVATRQITKEVTSEAVTFARSHSVDAVNVSNPLVIVGLLTPDGTSRMFWNAPNDIDVVSAVGATDIFRLIALAKQNGFGNVSLVTSIPFPTLELLGKRRLDEISWELRDVRPIEGTPFGVVEVGPASPSGSS